jgi:NodT family efflux transporter outer membrane factor (OMF) lipoprotein
MGSSQAKEKLAPMNPRASCAKGHDFSRVNESPMRKRALAPAGGFSGKSLFVSAACLAVLLPLAGCKPVGPNYQRPTYTAPPAYKEAGASTVVVPPPNPADGGWQPANPSDGMLKGKWWETYNDPQLNQLEERIATYNQGLRQALQTYLAARDQVKIARSALFPTLSAGPSVTHYKNSAHRPLTTASTASNYNDLTLEGQASWEPDFWGRIRRTVEAARDNAQASAADMANVDLSLHAELAEDYFNLRGLDAQTQLLQSDIKDLTSQLDLTKRRLSGGVAMGTDVAQAQTQLDTIRAQLIDVGIARAEYEHAIGTIAYYKLPGFSIAPNPINTAGSVDLPSVPVGLPSQLLQRRPDIAAAERRAQQSNALIGVAVAAFYPTITLGGSGGFESTHGGTWLQGPSSLWSLGGQAAELLIDGGRRRAVTAQARDNFEASAANYKNTVFTAFQEVEDKLSDLRILEEEETAEAAAVADAQNSLNLSNIRYKGGVTTYLEVLTAETTLIQNQRTETNLKSQRFAKTVELIRALGGGWDTTQLPK